MPTITRSFAIFTILLLPLVSVAEDYDVDLADGLDISAFHKNDNNTVKLWEKNKDSSASTSSSFSLKSLFGKNLQLRESYSLGNEGNNLQQAMASAYQKMATSCEGSWEKSKEWSERNEDQKQQYFLYFEFKCLKN